MPIPTRCLALVCLLGVACHPRPKIPHASGAPAAAVRLQLLTLNDFHGQLDPQPLRSSEEPARMLRIGGAAALLATVAELRAQNPTGTLVLDGGDMLQGSLASNSSEGLAVFPLYQRLGVVATVLGNHEFDFGPRGPAAIAGPGQDPRGALKAWIRQAPFAVLAANITKDGQPVGWPGLQRSVLVERKGVRIGIVGLTTTHTPKTTMPQNVADLRFEPLAKTLRREAAALRRRGAQLVIALAHAGGVCRGEGEASCRGEAFDLARALPRGTVEVIVAGHSHRCFRHRVNGIFVTQACALGRALGRLELEIVNGRLDPQRSVLHPPLPICHDVFADSGGCEAGLRKGAVAAPIVKNPVLGRHRRALDELAGALLPYRQAVRRLTERELIHLPRALPHHARARSPLGSLLAQLLRAAVPGADVAILNAGGIRGGLSAGTLRYGDLYRVFPFDNRVAVVQLSGRQLRALIEASLGHPPYGILQLSGLRLALRCGRPAQIVSVGSTTGEPLSDRKLYRVVLSDFLLAGGDGMGPVLAQVPAERKTVSPLGVRDALARGLERLRKASPAGTVDLRCAEKPSKIKQGLFYRCDDGVLLPPGGCGRATKRAGRPICW